MTTEARGLDNELAQYDAGLTFAGSLREALEVCDAVARDMGMIPVRGEEGCISFREPLLGVRSRFGVSLRAILSGEKDCIHGYVVGSSKGGRTPGQREYVKTVVSVFLDRVAREASSPRSTAQTVQARQRHRCALRTLRAIGWIPTVLLVPVSLLAAEYLRRPWSIMVVVAWLWLVVTVPATCELLRKRRIGTQSRVDLGLVVALTAVLLPYAALLIVLGIVRS